MLRLESRAIVAWLGAALVCIGCKRTPPPAHQPSRCAALEATNRALLAGASGNALSPELRQALLAASVCRETPRGAWGIELSELRTEDAESSARWALVHVDALGVRASVSPDTDLAFAPASTEFPAKRPNLEWSAYRKVSPTLPILYDYDHDGEPEAIEIVDTVDVHESGWSYRARRGRVWSASANGIELYPAARELVVEEVRDVDADQRPDLLTHGPFAALATIQCGTGEGYPVYGPLLLAHALTSGAFSLSDAQAVVFATQECRAAPSPLLVHEANGDLLDFAATARNVACSRLWDVPTAPMAVEIAKGCIARDPCPTCDDAAMLTRWAATVPPLRLRGAE